MASAWIMVAPDIMAMTDRVPLTDGIIATSDALKRKEGEHEQMLVPDERLTVAYEQGAFCCVNDVTPAR